MAAARPGSESNTATLLLPILPSPLSALRIPGGTQGAVAAVVSPTAAAVTAAAAAATAGSAGAAVGPSVSAQAARSGLLAALGQCAAVLISDPGGDDAATLVAPDISTYLYSTPPSQTWRALDPPLDTPSAQAVAVGSAMAAHASGVLVTAIAVVTLLVVVPQLMLLVTR